LLPLGLYAHELTPPLVPSEIAVQEGYRPFLQGYATGTQNYICLPSGSSVTWKLVGPQATLFDDDARQIITHFLSLNPDEDGVERAAWQHARDTSTIWAMAVARSSDANFVEPEAVPWLLLRVVGADFGPTGGDRLMTTAYIQRVHTSGGIEPTTGCTQEAHIGARAFVPYHADYVFYKATRHGRPGREK
jgi:hypothetical protein